MVVIYFLFLFVGTFLLKYTKLDVMYLQLAEMNVIVSGVNVKLTEFLVYVIVVFAL